MSSMALDTTEQPTKRQLARREASAPGKVTGKLKVGIDAMVWQGLDYAEAARYANLQAQAIRYALNKPHVKAYYTSQLEVLRTSERARNIHRAREIRDAENNMPAIHAIKYLDHVPDENASTSKGMAPGFVVQIVNVQQTAQPANTSVQVIENE